MAAAVVVIVLVSAGVLREVAITADRGVIWRSSGSMLVFWTAVEGCRVGELKDLLRDGAVSPIMSGGRL